MLKHAREASVGSAELGNGCLPLTFSAISRYLEAGINFYYHWVLGTFKIQVPDLTLTNTCRYEVLRFVE